MIFDDVFVADERVLPAGEYEEGGVLTTAHATHYRHLCIGARAGFGDLLIGAVTLMMQANGLDSERYGHVRDATVELIKIVEGILHLRRRRVGLRHRRPGRPRDAGPGVRQRRQAAVGHADL